MTFATRLASLPQVEDVAGIELHGPQGQTERIENRPGSAGSVRVYAYLLGRYGVIDLLAAQEGVEIYAEHAEDAHGSPGKHPNIDRLFEIQRTGAPWRGEVIRRA